MSFDPRTEDFQRSVLRTLQTAHAHDRFSGVRTLSELRRSYSEGRELPSQTDADRAFHLVVAATEHYDYELPFASSEDAANKLIRDSFSQVQEALKLDPDSPDARRLAICINEQSFEESYLDLKNDAESTYEHCKKELDTYLVKLQDPELMPIAQAVFMAPAYRWYATLADRALVCGRYKSCIAFCQKLRKLDPADQADVFRTQALAQAKLQDQAPLALLASQLRRQGRVLPDAWLSLSQAYAAWSARKFSQADTHIQAIVDTYPHAGVILTRQIELPLPAYARVVLQPQTEDELAVATSEAVVLLQEGQDYDGTGGFGSYVKNHPLIKASVAAEKNLNFDPSFEDSDDPFGLGGPADDAEPRDRKDS